MGSDAANPPPLINRVERVNLGEERLVGGTIWWRMVTNPTDVTEGKHLHTRQRYFTQAPSYDLRAGVT